MNKAKKITKAGAVIITIMAAMIMKPLMAIAGNLEPSSAPGSTMHTLDEIYNKLAILEALSKTADQVCVGNTFIGLQDDGTIGEMVGTSTGCGCGNRLMDNGDGTVTDCRTDHIWLKNANCFGYNGFWDDAMSVAAGLNDGECGLTDGSVENDWHLATIEELQGIGTDPPTTWGSGNPTDPWTMPGTPFVGVQSGGYWSSTEYSSNNAWELTMQDGGTDQEAKDADKGYDGYVWPVRNAN
jgi:hypothetical protein